MNNKPSYTGFDFGLAYLSMLMLKRDARSPSVHRSADTQIVFVQHELHRMPCSVVTYACGSESWKRVKRQQQDTVLCNELDNTASLLDFRPVKRSGVDASTTEKRRTSTYSAFRETKRAFTMKGSLGSLLEE